MTSRDYNDLIAWQGLPPLGDEARKLLRKALAEYGQGKGWSQEVEKAIWRGYSTNGFTDMPTSILLRALELATEDVPGKEANHGA